MIYGFDDIFVDGEWASPRYVIYDGLAGVRSSLCIAHWQAFGGNIFPQSQIVRRGGKERCDSIT